MLFVVIADLPYISIDLVICFGCFPEKDAFVLCRIFQKSGPGPKNGEKYGAPFIEEEWEDEHEVAYFPGEEAPMADEAAFDDDVYFDVNELDQVCTIPLGFWLGKSLFDTIVSLMNLV